MFGSKFDLPDADEEDRTEGCDLTEVLLDTAEFKDISLPHGESVASMAPFQKYRRFNKYKLNRY